MRLETNGAETNCPAGRATVLFVTANVFFCLISYEALNGYDYAKVRSVSPTTTTAMRPAGTSRTGALQKLGAGDRGTEFADGDPDRGQGGAAGAPAQGEKPGADPDR